jgi:TonB-linked SusC/RagA family outer membrane protein
MELKKLVKKTIPTLLLSMFCLVAFAQDRLVSGTVTDSAGEPIIGANILVVGTTNGVITDINGNFKLQQVPENAKIQVSFIGFITQIVTVGNQSTIKVILTDDSKALDEVVVIGYGTVKRRDLTGAVASVSGEKLAANPVANVAQALQGMLPGVSVTSQDGRPGATMSIRIRGGGSITQSNEPLFIVDGVQVSGIEDIPADNIESIDVLKDAASTAIYGARGANGVILVTTKGGQEGRVSVRYNMYYQMKEKPELLEVLDAYDYVRWNWAYGTAYNPNYGDGVAKYFGLGSKYGNHLNEYKDVDTHNYINDLMRSAGSWNHDLSLSGGSDKTKYYASVNYTDDEGIRINSGFSRWSANFKISQVINKSLNFDADLRYTEMGYTGTRYDMATSAFKYRPVDNPLGDVNATSGFYNGSSHVETGLDPVSVLNNYDNLNNIQRIRAKGGLTWKIIKGLTAKSELSLNRNWQETKNWDGGLEAGFSTAKLTNRNGYGLRWATTANYELQGLGEDNSLSFLVGNEVLASKNNSSAITGAGYPEGFGMNDAFGMISMTDTGLGKDAFSASIGTPNHTQSWFGRGNYSYKGRYLLTATFRADGSSKFAPNNHWGYFPAAAAAWRISDEPFMKDTTDWLDNLKLRLSYGTSGSDNIDASLWKETWTTSQITVDGQPVTVYQPGSMQGNPDLKWETTVSRNAGIDFGFFNNRIRGSLDLYWNTTNDILMKIPVDASAGYSYQFQNVGQTSNKGVELALGADLIRTKDFNLAVNLTYNFNKNNIDELNEDALADTHTGWGSSMLKPYYDYVIRKGNPVGLIQGFQSDGFYTVDDFDYANGTYTLKQGIPDTQSIVNYAGMGNFKRPAGQNAFPGMVKFKDVDESGTIDDGDATIIGKTLPQHTGGFNLNGNYKSLDFALGFTYQIGGDIYNANAMHSMMGDKDSSLGANRLAIVKDCFRIYDVDAGGDLVAVTEPDALIALNRNAKYALNYSEYGIVNSQFIEDASYLRLQTLTVGYTLPKNWTKKAGVEKVRLYFTGGNLFCLTGYSGLDPDVSTNMDGIDGFPVPNYDYNAYPKTRSYTFGLNISF